MTHKKRETRSQKRPKRLLLAESKELVHIQKSPNYCKQDFENGVLGTEGRKCNSTSTGPDSCNKLCCGRGYITRVGVFKRFTYLPVIGASCG